MQRKKTFLVVCVSILTTPLWAQTFPPRLLINSGLVIAAPMRKAGRPSLLKDASAPVADPALYRQALSPMGEPDAAGMGGPGYCGRLGFFCRKELGFEQQTHIPLRLRLGSLAECNRLEGKPGW